MTTENLFIGIDVQDRRGCCYAVVDEGGVLLASGWLADDPETGTEALVTKWKAQADVMVGIDAPRQPLPSKRSWFWDGKNNRWRKRGSEKGYGRHCEIVVSAHRIANPQWTPVKGEARPWMELGFRLFAALEGYAQVHEVFPSASYRLLAEVPDVRLSLNFSAFHPGPKDMIDACVAAATVREFTAGNGIEVGGGDGFGTIVLPRPLPEPLIEGVLNWPERA